MVIFVVWDSLKEKHILNYFIYIVGIELLILVLYVDDLFLQVQIHSL
jgi:hypothetical protein